MGERCGSLPKLAKRAKQTDEKGEVVTDCEQYLKEESHDWELRVRLALKLPAFVVDKSRAAASGTEHFSAQSASDNDDPAEHGDTGLIVAPEKPKLAKPPLWKVVMLNDDYTPMEFVVDVLQTFFGMNGEKATQIMLMVHRTGKGTCGIFPRDIAETKCAQVNQYAQENQHPLVSEIEPADD